MCHSYQELCASTTECGLMCHRIQICCNYRMQHAEKRQQLYLGEQVLLLELLAVSPNEDVQILIAAIILSLISTLSLTRLG